MIKRVILLIYCVLLCVEYVGQNQLWGMTLTGGQYNRGVIFKTDENGANYTVARYFGVDYPGINPGQTKLCKATNGKFYGLTSKGGANNLGVLFSYDPTIRSYKKKVDFSGIGNGSGPNGSLIQATNGKLYGMTYGGGTNSLGTIIEYDITTDTCIIKYSFGGVNGSFPFGSLLQATNGKLYGMTFYGGSINNNGVLFEFDPNTGSYVKKIDFDGTLNGAGPQGSLIQGANGKLYGMTSAGGVNNKGVLFEYDPTNNTILKKMDFDGSNSGSGPVGSLLEVNNKLHGMTTYGGINNKGVLFDFDYTTNIYTKHLDFSGTADGAYPYGDLEQTPAGKLYGMVQQGGANNLGVLFEYDPATIIYSKLYDFGGVNGNYPRGSLTVDGSGKLYGLTSEGGVYNNSGVVFEYNLSTNGYNKLINLNGNDGANPEGSLIKAGNGILYGMCGGGFNGKGVIFSYDPVLNVYSKKIDLDDLIGRDPYGSMLEANNGKLYGMTQYGGVNNRGVLFEYDPISNLYTKKIDFDATSLGSQPIGDLIQANNGKLYGMTQYGGTSGYGTLFEYDIVTNVISKKVDFSLSICRTPTGSLVQANNNKLYGISTTGGASNNGVLFEFDPLTGIFTKKLDFGAGINTYQPIGSLANSSLNKLYGMTQNSIYEYDPNSNVFAKVFTFTGNNGYDPHGTLTEGPNGKLYGLTNANNGGSSTNGVIFEFDPVTYGFIKRVDLIPATGYQPAYTTLLGICIPPSAPTGISPQVFCMGDSVASINASGINIKWYDSPISTITIAPTTALVNANHYFGTQTNGCESMDRLDILVNLNSLPVITATSNSVCIGTSANIVASGATSYVWSTGANTVSISITPTVTDTYTVTGTDLNSCTSTQTVEVVVNNTCQDVWPGDANSDGTANNLDVLELGLHYAQTGPPRASVSNAWQSFHADNWAGTINNGQNLNHSDCNGDGTINNDDTLAIYNNYGLTHPFKQNANTTSNPQLRIVPNENMLLMGYWGSADIFLGDASNPITNINGVAFTVDFDNSLIEQDSIYLKYTNSFIDASNQNLKFRKLNFANGKLYTATTHTNNINVSGNGKIGTLHYKIKYPLTQTYTLQIGLSQANQSDASGVITSLTSGTGIVEVINGVVGVQSLTNDNLISVSPNPAINELTVRSNSEIEKVEITNLTGQIILCEQVNSRNHKLNLENISNGVYFVKAYSNSKQITIKKLVVQK